MQKWSVFSGLLNIITVLASKICRLNYPNGTKWRFQDEITVKKNIGVLQNGKVTTVFELLLVRGLWEVLWELTVYDPVESVAVCLISTRLFRRAVGHAVALGVTHVGSADAATVRAREVIGTCAVLTWRGNENSTVITNERHNKKRKFSERKTRKKRKVIW